MGLLDFVFMLKNFHPSWSVLEWLLLSYNITLLLAQ